MRKQSQNNPRKSSKKRRCKYCGAPIIWAKSGGKWLPWWILKGGRHALHICKSYKKFIADKTSAIKKEEQSERRKELAALRKQKEQDLIEEQQNPTAWSQE